MEYKDDVMWKFQNFVNDLMFSNVHSIIIIIIYKFYLTYEIKKYKETDHLYYI